MLFPMLGFKFGKTLGGDLGHTDGSLLGKAGGFALGAVFRVLDGLALGVALGPYKPKIK